MKALKIRSLVGSIVGMVTSLACVLLLFLPMLVEVKNAENSSNLVLYNVFESMFNIGEVSQTLGAEGTFYIVATVMMMAFFALSIVSFVLNVLSLVGACLFDSQPKVAGKLNMAIALRALSLLTAVLGTIATILLVLYFESNGLTHTTFGYGTIVPLVVSLLGVGAAFTLSSNFERRVLENKLKRVNAVN